MYFYKSLPLLFRYLYINCRSWPEGCLIVDPYSPPPIAQGIKMHVIDLHKMVHSGPQHSSHKAYTPNDDCFFVFLDVCNEYVAR